MGSNHGSLAGGDGVPKGLIGHMRNIHHHAQAIHFEHYLLAEVGQPVVMLDFGIVDISGGVRPFIGIGPAQGHVADTEAIVVAEEVHVVLNGVPALNTHQGRQLVFFVSAFDVGNAEGHHHAIGMPGGFLVDGVDQVEGMLREMSLVGLRLYPDREEFRTQISRACLVETDLADVLRIRAAKVEVALQETLRRVGVRVDHNGGVVNREGLGADACCVLC